MPARILALMAAGLAALSAAAGPAFSGHRGARVTACSGYGNGCYTASVRTGRFGPEMRLKGGTWIDCRGDCRETLREETIDFWETQNDKALVTR